MAKQWIFYYCDWCDLTFATDTDLKEHPHCPSCGLDENTMRNEQAEKENEDETEY